MQFDGARFGPEREVTIILIGNRTAAIWDQLGLAGIFTWMRIDQHGGTARKVQQLAQLQRKIKHWRIVVKVRALARGECPKPGLESIVADELQRSFFFRRNFQLFDNLIYA